MSEPFQAQKIAQDRTMTEIDEGASAIGACAWPSDSPDSSKVASTTADDSRGLHLRMVHGALHMAMQFVIFLMR